MAPILYMQQFSGPVRSVLLTAEALGLKLQHKIIDLSKKEHLSPEFCKINPQHTIPTLDDNGVIIADSHVINGYLVDKYGKDDSLYPKDLVKRAQVDHKLHFDTGPVFSWLRLISRGVKYRGLTALTAEHTDGLSDTYEHLNNFLDGNLWVTGDTITIADLCLIANVTTLNSIYPVDAKKYPNLDAWLKRAKNLPYYHVNEPGLESYRQSVAVFLR